jgi:hypothetical protein
MRKLIIPIICGLGMSCATVELPIEGSDEVIRFKGFASDMSITLPATETQGERTVNISAHATEGPVLEAVKSIAPFAAMAIGQ